MAKKAVIWIAIMMIIFTIPVSAREAPFSIEADNLTIDRTAGFVKARGEVEVDFGRKVLLAESVNIDLDTKDLLAEGNVVYREPNRELTGPKLLYNYGTKQGKFIDADGEIEGNKISGDEIKMIKGDFKIDNADLTTCESSDAHYKFTAEKVNIHPDDILIAEDVEVWLFGRHVFSYPVYKYSLKHNVELTPVPIIGYTSNSGYYMELDYEHFISRDLQGDIHTRWTSRDANELRFDYDYDVTNDIELNPIFDYQEEEGWYSRFIFDGDFDYGFNLDFDAKYDRPKEVDRGEIIGDIKLRQQQGGLYWQLERDYHKEWNYSPQLTLGSFDSAVGKFGLISNLKYRIGDVYFDDRYDTGPFSTDEDDEDDDDETYNELDESSEIRRQDLKWTVWSEDYELGPDTTLDTDTVLRKAWYGTDQEYSSYQTGFYLEHGLEKVTDIEAGFDYVHELGGRPEEFEAFKDELNDESSYLGWTGWRRYYDFVLDGHWITLGEDQKLKWEADVHRAVYEPGNSYDYYGYEANYRHTLTDSLLGILDYEYRRLPEDASWSIKDRDIEREEMSNYDEEFTDYDNSEAEYNPNLRDKINFGLDYEINSRQNNYFHAKGIMEYDLLSREYTTATLDLNYESKKQDHAYWSVDGKLKYDIIDNIYPTRTLEIKRVYDCMDLSLTFDWIEDEDEPEEPLERVVELKYEIKY
ncbi:LPS-assembly protein LptD [Acetohalobium arabaticum]|uniref:OstA family protein n=1 Tax=Acetohalobium arabaticum (strain ATCC 49924 / DSM 5501 / Z-7288) TaxID=574087 RepID=D9QTT6_ACEAZ|nr:LPS-assembly protein LptD [Acetohalobium arabaticum]ADL13657.1 OstA family protein [Acetohalobium arabaticum DSM 5501]